MAEADRKWMQTMAEIGRDKEWQIASRESGKNTLSLARPKRESGGLAGRDR